MPRDPIHDGDKEGKKVCFLALHFKRVVLCPLAGWLHSGRGGELQGVKLFLLTLQSGYFLFKKILFIIYLFLAALGLLCRAQTFSSCGEWMPLSVNRSGVWPLIAVASLVVEHRLWGARASIVVTSRLRSCGTWALDCKLSSCGTWAELSLALWDLPRPGIEPCIDR